MLPVGEAGKGWRLDRFVTERIGRLNRSQVRALIDRGEVLLGDRRVKAGTKLRVGDSVSVVLEEEDKPPIARDDVELEVVHEDEDVLAVSKPAGMATQPRHRFEGGSLVNALMTYLDLPPDQGPRVMHRLDRDTSGVILVAKTSLGANSIGRQFNNKQVRKEYRALVHGAVAREHDLIERPIGQRPEQPERCWVDMPDSKPARSRVRRLERIGEGEQAFSWLAMWPHTGRTHQLRIHAAWMGHPIVCDDYYGLPRPEGCLLERQALHAARITFRHPASGEQTTLEAPVPADIQAELDRLRALAGSAADGG